MKEYERSNKADHGGSSRQGARGAEVNGSLDPSSRSASSGAKIRSSPSVPPASKSVSMDDATIEPTSTRPRPSRHQSDHSSGTFFTGRWARDLGTHCTVVLPVFGVFF